ncbi:unnamed protein product [Sphenostylis stenocarpa]|uniref:Co-chaperone protein p23 n=1 Tax=Sphenostylis stenocarpa TaxID=92480 RepID=A0AA86SKP4_9FABA|nr:unnamed protein product [Sphenostylis stenocarpa]
MDTSNGNLQTFNNISGIVITHKIDAPILAVCCQTVFGKSTIICSSFFLIFWLLSCSRHPSVKWAQRSDVLYLTVELPDAKDVKLKLEPEGKFYFSATAGSEKIPYEVDIDLFDKIDVDNSKASVGSRNICYLVKKAENKWWDRLLKQGGKSPVFLKVDWDKWVDEDEEQESQPADDSDFGDLDLSKLNMGGGEGLDFDAAGNDDDDESDTEEEEDAAEASTSNELDTKDVVSTDPKDTPDSKATTVR